MIGLLFAVASVLAAPQAVGRPAEFNEYSSSIVSAAVDARRTGVSAGEASSVASVIVSRGLEPRQVTEMIQMGERLLANTKSINPTSLSALANVFASAYTSMHTQASYVQLIDYIKAHTSIYDVEKVMAGPSASAREHAGAENRRQLIEMYGSLMGNSNGRHAIETFSQVFESYMKDLGIQGGRGGLHLMESLYNFI